MTQNCLVQSAFLEVSTDPSTVGYSWATLIAVGSVDTPLTAGNQLKIIVPSALSVQAGSKTCSFEQPNGARASCSISGKIITATLQTTLSSSFQLEISDCIENPSSTTPTSTFSFQALQSGQIVDSISSGIFLIATVEVTSGITLIPDSEVVGASTRLTVEFPVNHEIESDGYLELEFPYWNPESSSPTDYLQSSVTCVAVGFINSVISCIYDSSNQILTVSNVRVSTVPTTASFYVEYFTNPISTDETTDVFTLTTYTSEGGAMDTGSSTLQISQGSTITSGSLTVDSSTPSSISGIVQETNNLFLTFDSPVPLNAVCNVEIVMPEELDLTNTDQLDIFGLFGSFQILTGSEFTLDTTTNTLTFQACSNYRSNLAGAEVTIYNVILPDYTKETSSVAIYLTTGDNNEIAEVATGITFTASPGALTMESASPETNVVQSTTSVDFEIAPQQRVSVDSRLEITIPDTYSGSFPCSLTSTVIVNSGASCSYVDQIFTIDNFLGENFDPDTSGNLIFTLNSVTLPETIKSQSGFAMNLYIQDQTDFVYYEVSSYSSSIPFSLKAGSISVLIIPFDKITSITTSYVIQFTPQHDVPENGYILISYPDDISISDTSYSASAVTDTLGFPSTPSFSISNSARRVTINNGFRGSAQSGGTIFQFTMPGITNPLTTIRTSAFIVTIYRSDGNIIDQSSGGEGTYVQMTDSSYMESVVIALGSYVNSDVTSYTFSMTANVAITSSNKIFIEFPEEVILPDQYSTLDCIPVDESIIRSVTCRYSSRVDYGVQITLTLASGVSEISELQTFAVTMYGIQNPESTNSTSNFFVTVTDSGYNPINTNPTDLSIATTTPSEISNEDVNITQNTTKSGQYASYSIVFYPTHDILEGGGVQVTYPAQVDLPNRLSVDFESEATVKSPKVTYDKNTRVILIQEAFARDFVQYGINFINITFYGFQNPLENIVTDSFIVQTFNEDPDTGEFYYIDWIISDLSLNSECNYPCRTCDAEDASFCTSCYSTGYYNKLQENTCVSSCALGNYEEFSLGECLPCDETCLNCKSSATNCITCGVGDYLYLLDNQCLTSCPENYIQDATINQCVTCESPCETCLNTTSTCTSCLQESDFPYFYATNFQCYSECLADISVLEDNFCVDCDSNCKTCEGSTTHCTSCESYMRFDQLKAECIQVCEKGTQIYNQGNGACDYCSSNCETCSGTTSTCTTCPNELVLNMDSTCQASCNNASQIAIEMVCESCQLPCSECKDSTTHCTKCAGEYLLFNTTCIQYCPLKYEANNETGQCVLVGLICPTGFSINEAGDGCIPTEIECRDGYMINTGRTACIPEPGFPVPFPFIILSICFVIIVLGSYIRDKFFTKVVTCLIALVGTQEILIYILMVGYAFQLEQYVASILALVALIMLVVSNLAFFIYYRRDILKKDAAFFKWCRMYPRTSTILPKVALVLNFKLIKMLYSGFFGQESCLAQFDEPKAHFLQPLRMITYFSFVFVYVPIIVADAFIYIQVEWGYQLLVLAIESLILAIFIMVLTVIEFRNVNKLIMTGDEQYIRIKPKSHDGPTNVMSGLIDMDESTLIRSKVADDDYEVQLRKRALFSILDQVGKNFFQCQEKGTDLGGNLDHCMTKFDEEKVKLRRAFSLEAIKEEDSWVVSDNEQDQESEEEDRQRRYSYPLTPRTMGEVRNPQFQQTLQDIKQHAKEQLLDNVYVEVKAAEKQRESKKKKQVSRRTQTYLRELLCLEEDDIMDSDLEIIMEDEAEIDQDFAKDLIENVIDGLSDSESGIGKKKGKKKKNLAGKRAKEIPDFELADIMGEFEIDDLGNFIILKGEKSELLDKKERRVNRRGYLVDRFGNVINNKGQIIFKQVELDSDDEIPAPFGFEKRKKNLLNMAEEGQFKVQDDGKQANIDDDEEIIDKELKSIKKEKKKRKKAKLAEGGQVVHEEDDEESSVDSLMADSPGKYQIDGEGEDEFIDKVTKKKIPRKMRQKLMGHPVKAKKGSSPEESQRKKAGGSPSMNNPPKRIKRDDTKEMFPYLLLENSEQKKLYKLAESIGGLAQQYMDDSRSVQAPNLNQSTLSHERLEKLKQEHFRDIMSSSQGGRPGDSSKDLGKAPVSFANIGNRIVEGPKQKQHQTVDKKLPPKPTMEKVYGNLGDVVQYEEKHLMDQMRAGGASPFSSQLTHRVRQEMSSLGGPDRRLRGLESIYMQKFDKKNSYGPRKPLKAKFRQTMNKFEDAPDLLMNDGGMDFSQQNEISMMVADKLDRLQRQYMSNTATNQFDGYNMAGMGEGNLTTGGAMGRKPGSISSSMFQDGSLEPVKKGNWVKK